MAFHPWGLGDEGIGGMRGMGDGGLGVARIRGIMGDRDGGSGMEEQERKN